MKLERIINFGRKNKNFLIGAGLLTLAHLIDAEHSSRMIENGFGFEMNPLGAEMFNQYGAEGFYLLKGLGIAVTCGIVKKTRIEGVLYFLSGYVLSAPVAYYLF